MNLQLDSFAKYGCSASENGQVLILRVNTRGIVRPFFRVRPSISNESTILGKILNFRDRKNNFCSEKRPKSTEKLKKAKKAKDYATCLYRKAPKQPVIWIPGAWYSHSLKRKFTSKSEHDFILSPIYLYSRSGEILWCLTGYFSHSKSLFLHHPIIIGIPFSYTQWDDLFFHV